MIPAGARARPKRGESACILVLHNQPMTRIAMSINDLRIINDIMQKERVRHDVNLRHY